MVSTEPNSHLEGDNSNVKRSRSLSKSFKNLFTSHSAAPAGASNSGKTTPPPVALNAKNDLKLKRNIPLVPNINTNTIDSVIDGKSNNNNNNDNNNDNNNGLSRQTSSGHSSLNSADDNHSNNIYSNNSSAGASIHSGGHVQSSESGAVNATGSTIPFPTTPIAANSSTNGQSKLRSRVRRSSNAGSLSQDPHSQANPRRSNTVSINAYYPPYESNGSSTASSSTNVKNQMQLPQFQNQQIIYKSDSFVLFKNFMHEHHLTVVPLITITSTHTNSEHPSYGSHGLEKIESAESLEKSGSPDAGSMHTEQSHTDLQSQGHHSNIKFPKTSAFSISTLFNLNKNESHAMLPNSQQIQQQQLQQQQQSDSPTQFQYHSSSAYTLSKKEVDCNNEFNSNIKYAKSLIYDTTPNSTSANANPVNTPNIVNNKAAISEDELNLINDLTTKMRKAMDLSEKNGGQGHTSNDKNKEESEEVQPSDDLSQNVFVKKYGLCIGTLGQGAYGVVKVSCKKLDKQELNNLDPNCKKTFRYKESAFFAIKELRPIIKKDNLADAAANQQDNHITDYDEKFCTRLTSEFVIGHALNHIGRHPNILKVLDLFTFSNTPNKFVQIMEFCPSGDLYSLIKSHPQKLHPLEIDCFIKQLINGVSYMHEHGVAHCDLKPENILFKPNGILKISDFGTACVFQTAWEKKCHMQTGCMGSEPYMAPEQFIPRSQYDPRLVDSWAIGMIYMAMSRGRYLWKSPIRDKDPEYADYLESIDPAEFSASDKKEFQLQGDSGTSQFYGDYKIFEDLKHVNSDIKLARLSCLYRIFNPNPQKRILVKDLLNTTWMKKTHCCVVYRHSL